MGDASEHFSYHEFRCRCGACEWVPPSDLLVCNLETLRVLVGCPIYVNSACRCPDHNQAVGGATYSRHLTHHDGVLRRPDAADIVVPGLTLRRSFFLARTIDAFRNGGIGVYPWWPGLHLDVRSTKARWFQENAGDPMTAIPSSYYLSSRSL